MNGNQNNIGGPAPLPGEPVSQQGRPEVQPQAQPQSQEPKPTFVTKPPLPSSPPPPPLAPQPPQPRVGRVGFGPDIPSSPPSDIGIRTMASDLKSLKSSGGYDVKPETFRPEEFNQEPMFEPREIGLPGSESTKPVPVKSHSKLLISLGIVGFAVIAGLVIYFFVLPLIFPKKTTPPVVETPPPAEQPLVVETPLPITHQTFFITSPAGTVSMNLTNLNLAEVNSALNAVASGVQPQTIKEVALTVAGIVPEATDFMTLAFPELNKTLLISNFERDFTVFVYRDTNGSWPGYIFRLKPESSLVQVAGTIKAIESSTNIANLYLLNLTSPSPTGFKDGLKIMENTARYLSYGTPGASLNYGWFNNYLVIGTSYNGFREGLKLLGYTSQ